MMKRIRFPVTAMLVVLGLCAAALATETHARSNRPNIVLLISDDQGYGDMGRHGNPFLKTPNMDRLHDESVRLTDFSVSPTCSPTRYWSAGPYRRGSRSPIRR